MQDQDWQRLGLSAPTTDLLAIKRAYAARLKLTRPDDDAEAYQALRQTYEWAQQWARWQAANEAPNEAAAEATTGTPTDIPTQTPTEAANDQANDQANVPAIDQASPAAIDAAREHRPPPAASPVTTPTASAAADDFAPVVASPEALATRAFEIWRDRGDAALIAHWPALRAGLDALPFGDLPEASARLADMVIHLPALPEAWVIEVERHFGWRGDFRMARLIGPQRAQALFTALEERIVRPIADEATLARIEPLLRVARLARAGRSLRALLHAVLEGGALKGLYDALPAPQWRALGHDAMAQAAVRKVLGWALSLRLTVAVGLLGAVLWLSGRPALEVVVLLGAGGFLGLLAYPLSIAVAAWLTTWFGLRGQGTAFAARLRSWHAQPRRPLLGLGLLGAAAAAGAWAGGAASPAVPVLPWLPWLVLTVVGALALWPQDPYQGAVVVSGVAVGTFIVLGMLPAGSPAIGTPAAVALSLGAAWALLASTAYERGWWGTRENRGIAKPQVWPFAPLVNSLALGDRWGHRFAMAPVPMLAALALAGIVDASPWRVFIAWVLIVLALGLAQGLMFDWSQRLAARDEDGARARAR